MDIDNLSDGPPRDFNEVPNTKAELQRHEKFYYNDGDLVIIVENTIFRIDQVVLRRKSTVFSDMLANPPPADMETADGVPSVRLSGDSTLAFTLLMEVLFEPYTRLWGNPADVEHLMDLLEIANKYQFDSIVDMVSRRMAALIPTTFDQLLSVRPHWPSLRSIPISASVKVINAVRKFGLSPGCLPFFLYSLSTWGNLPYNKITPLEIAHLQRLSTEDQHLVSKAQRRLLQETAITILGNLEAPEDGPFGHSPKLCGGCSRDPFNPPERSRTAAVFANPLFALLNIALPRPEDNSLTSLCKAGAVVRRGRAMNLAESFFTNLSDFLGLGP